MEEGFEFALKRLADESKPARTINLAALSDLPRHQADTFRVAWASLSSQRRFELVSELVEQAEANVRLNFGVLLRSFLDDTDPRVRRLAVEGLWEDNRTSLVDPLVRLLSSDPSASVRAAAAVSLARFVLMGELGEIRESVAKQAEDALRSAWSERHEVTEVRRRALEGLAYLSDAGVRELIHSAYYDEDALMRQSAIFAMGRSADRRWAKVVLAELKSRDAAMRFEAASAAGELTLPGAVRPLIQLLDDTDSSVREAAATALGQIGGPEARRALEACAASDDESLAQAAEVALEELAFNSGSVGNPLFDYGGQSVSVGDDDDVEMDDDSALEFYRDEFGILVDDTILEDDEAFLEDGYHEDDEWYDEDDEDDDEDWN